MSADARPRAPGPDADGPAGTDILPARVSAPLLSVRDLRTYFHTDAGVARAVDGISFDLRRGEILGIVGESGCGKSVTSLSILGLVPDPPGRIMPGSSVRLRGRELVGLPVRELRAVRGADIAMIFQEPMTSLNPVYPVGDQVAEPLRLHLGLSRRAARTRAVELLELVGIAAPERRVSEYPHQLSGGMRQRVMIAMALACEPDVLIADEPTTALDVTIQAQILELIAGLRERLGMAVLLITHDLGIVAETCDHVLVMYAGRVVESGPVESIFRMPGHPYTEGLLGAVPRLGEDADRLAVIPGQVPSAYAWPPGCRFAARCPYAWERCAQEPPLLPGVPAPLAGAGVADQATAARCWLVEEPERRAGAGFSSGAEAAR
ncbi:MAG TPA: ABC transporter ATP-binding protein [Longimicrobiales bacterium]|nr:ABC transporter ATP-binding protein [Longimicrobiales bacterium]